MRNRLMIEKIEHGGFLVTEPGFGGNMTHTLLSSTTIDEALAWIKEEIEPTLVICTASPQDLRHD